MSSNSRRVDDLYSSFAAERPHFFKIILDDSIRAGKLEIPKKFVKEYGSSLPNRVFLAVPSGTVWEVEISKHGDTVWLHNGWREFAEYYSLGYGHLLVFEDKGCSEFLVIIFDKSASEINYPCHATSDDKKPERDEEPKKHEKNTSIEDDPVEIIDDFTTKRRARERPPLKAPQPRKKMRNDNTFPTGSTFMSASHPGKNVSLSSGSKLRTSDSSGKPFGGGGGLSADQRLKSGFVQRSQPLTYKETSEALKRANSFRSKNPYFMVVMQPTYVSGRYTLAIPNNFARKHIGEKSITVTLCVSHGRNWSAKYYYYSYHSNATTVIRKGWKKFANENSLKVGDVCAFEMIKTHRIKFKVFIFRVDEDPYPQTSIGNGGATKMVETSFGPDYTCNNGSGTSRLCDKLTGKDTQAFLTRQNGGSPSLSRCRIKRGESPSPSFQPQKTEKTNQSGRTLICEEKDKALQKAIGFKSERPFFMITMQPSYLSPGYKMGVPKRFFKRYIMRNQGHIVLQVQEGRTWTVKFVSTKYASFYGGWKAFSEDNNLQVGDVCVFELIKGNALFFKVFIYRGAKDGKFRESALREGASEECTQTPSCVRISDANTAVDNFNSEYPFFSVIICSSDLSNGSLSLPRTFVMKYIKQESQEMRFTVEDKSWPVNAVVDAVYSGKIICGWTEFARENALQVGDVCLFELVQTEIVVLKVSIFRCVS